MNQENAHEPKCVICGVKERRCETLDGSSPGFCPTVYQQDAIERAKQEYGKDDVREFARNASIQEGEAYAYRGSGKPVQAVKPRVQEVVEFAHKMGFRKIGIAFCAGLRFEASLIEKIFSAQNLEVVSVVCKTGAVPKESIGIEEHQKISPGEYESMCNPVAQAMVLNEQGTQFNVLVGLCVGHDSLFLKYSEAPCTVLVVKDRVTGHNPLAAVYTSASYYRRLQETELGSGGAVDIVPAQLNPAQPNPETQD